MLTSSSASTVGNELCTNPIVRKVSVTGSTEVGKLIMKLSSGTLKKVSLELGGNAPFIVFDDADLDAAVQGAVAIEKCEDHIADGVSKGVRLSDGGKRHPLGGHFLRADGAGRRQPADEDRPRGGVRRCSASIPRSRRSAWPTTPSAASPPYYFYARELGRIWRVAEALKYGIVGVNEGIISTEVAPFGGMKESGMGREGSKYGAEEHCELKYICMCGI